MTYCVGILLDAGLVLLADSRTNAGVDHVSSFRKIAQWEAPGERVVVLLSAGNLAVTQAVTTLLDEGIPDAEGKLGPTMGTVPRMFDAARLVGEAVREVHRNDAEALKAHGYDFAATFILGGQIGGGRVRLFQIYAAGNFIEATAETRFFQIGETKYGKPILDRAVTSVTTLKEAAKLALVSMDSTIRSNISVDPPLDLLVYETNALKISRFKHIDEDDPHFRSLRKRWSGALKRALKNIPAPDV